MIREDSLILGSALLGANPTLVNSAFSASGTLGWVLERGGAHSGKLGRSTKAIL